MNILIIGRNLRRVEKQINELKSAYDHAFFGASSHVDMRSVFSSVKKIDAVIMSGGHEAIEKAHFVDYIIRASTSTAIYIKDRDSGHHGMVPFVATILSAHQVSNQAEKQTA